MATRLVVAVGGNAIHPGHMQGTVDEQIATAEATARSLLPIMESDNELVITHGNGPVVGKILMRQALASGRVAPMTLDICVAHSQGGIAYLLMQALENRLRKSGNSRRVVTVLTQVEVDPVDPAFQEPTKPIGYFYTKEEARKIGLELGWAMQEDAGRGWRHVVPSPEPQRIVEIESIADEAANGSVVIACGGGGIPIVRTPDGASLGAEAVIDKDLSSAVLANALRAEVIMLLTGVPHVALNYGTPAERQLRRTTLSEMRRHYEEGQFAEGSMGPKVKAAIRFLEGGGACAIIAHLHDAATALWGDCGTHIFPDAA
ncbi:MAG: carbamate kinase [Gammaproteobacteria bacterium]